MSDRQGTHEERSDAAVKRYDAALVELRELLRGNDTSGIEASIAVAALVELLVERGVFFEFEYMQRLATAVEVSRDRIAEQLDETRASAAVEAQRIVDELGG